MTDYPRMKYGHDQREWVRIANERLPALREEAIRLQYEAAEAYRASQVWPVTWMFAARRESANAAFHALNNVLYYEGMRRANLPIVE